MTTDNNTLADVQPGGRVRLGDQAERARFEAWVKNHVSSLARAADGEYASNLTHALWSAWQAALSAQPSPGGQGDALPIESRARELLAAELERDGNDQAASAIRSGDTTYGMKLLLASIRAITAALAARQPVGELHLPPDGFYKIVYDDAQVPDESFARTGALDAALRRFEQISARWNAHLFVRFANNTRDCTVPNATPAQAVDLAPDHRGMRVSCSGLLSQVRGGLKSNPELAEMVRQLHGHLNELGKRWYAGDRKVVDEFLQLYVIEDGARRALIDSQAVGK